MSSKAIRLDMVGLVHPSHQVTKRRRQDAGSGRIDGVNAGIWVDPGQGSSHTAFGTIPRHCATNLAAGYKCDPSGFAESGGENHGQTTNSVVAALGIQPVEVGAAAERRNLRRQSADGPGRDGDSGWRDQHAFASLSEIRAYACGVAHWVDRFFSWGLPRGEVTRRLRIPAYLVKAAARSRPLT